MSTGIESHAAAEWLRSTLEGDATLVALLGAAAPGHTGAVYADVAPEGAAFPCVIFTQMAATDVMVVGATRIFTNLLFLVKGVTQGTGYGPLAAIAARIDALLHRSPGGTEADGTTWGCYRERPFRLADVDKGQQYRNSGGLYRLFTTS